MSWKKIETISVFVDATLFVGKYRKREKTQEKQSITMEKEPTMMLKPLQLKGALSERNNADNIE